MKWHDLCIQLEGVYAIESEIKNLLDYHNSSKVAYTLRPDGVVDVTGNISIRECLGLSELPFKFGRVNGKFTMDTCGLTSLLGMPTVIDEYFYCDNNKIESIDGIPSDIGGYISLENNRITSLSRVHEHVKKMDGNFYIRRNPLKTACLGLIFIDGCEGLVSDYNSLDNIINKYMGKTHLLYDCQAELIEAGLEEFAKL